MKELKLVINTKDSKGTINKNIYGMFIEHTGRIINDGLYVGEHSDIPNKNGVRLDILDAFRQIHVPLLHWPGGMTSEFVHWRDSIGDKDERKRVPNTLGVREKLIDDNGFGLHEFFDLCEELDAEPYYVFGSGQVSSEEIAECMEYVCYDGDTTVTRQRKKNGREKPWKNKYLVIGNEWWFYESAASYMSRYGAAVHFAKRFMDRPFKVMRGPQSWDIHLTHRMMNALDEAPMMDTNRPNAMTLYFVMNEASFGAERKALGFSDEEYYTSLQYIPFTDRQLDRHLGVLKRNPYYDNIKLCVDEWGAWHDTYNMWEMHTTMRDAILAAATLNTFNNKCDVIEMAALCFAVNGLHSILLTQGDKMIKTPTFYVFDQYKAHQDATHVATYVEKDEIPMPRFNIPTISHSASIKDGKLLLSLVNVSATESVKLDGTVLYEHYTRGSGEILMADPRTENTFEAPELAKSEPFYDFKITENGLNITLPPCSVVTITLEQ